MNDRHSVNAKGNGGVETREVSPTLEQAFNAKVESSHLSV